MQDPRAKWWNHAAMITENSKRKPVHIGTALQLLVELEPYKQMKYDWLCDLRLLMEEVYAGHAGDKTP